MIITLVICSALLTYFQMLQNSIPHRTLTNVIFSHFGLQNIK